MDSRRDLLKALSIAPLSLIREPQNDSPPPTPPIIPRGDFQPAIPILTGDELPEEPAFRSVPFVHHEIKFPHEAKIVQHLAYSSRRIHKGRTHPAYRFFNYDMVSYHHDEGSFNTMKRTNLQRSNWFPPPHCQFVKRLIAFATPEANPEDFKRFASAYTLKFEVSDWRAVTMPLAMLPIIGDIGDLVVLNPENEQGIENTRWISSFNRRDVKLRPPTCYELDIPVRIEPMQFFAMTLEGPPIEIENDLTMYLAIDGPALTACQ